MKHFIQQVVIGVVVTIIADRTIKFVEKKVKERKSSKLDYSQPRNNELLN